MLDIREVWLSFLGAVMRFWDNRFIERESNEVRYLKMELEKERLEKRELLDKILDLLGNRNNESEPEQEEQNRKPLFKIHNWADKRREMEQKQRIKAEEIRRDNELKKERAKSTEQIEQELGITVGIQPGN